MHLVPNRARHANPTYRTFCLWPRGDVHAVNMQVRAVRYHVADVDADAKAYAAL
jgi:hypothetical protein